MVTFAAPPPSQLSTMLRERERGKGWIGSIEWEPISFARAPLLFA
ncbi:MAG: hypothetical protein QOH85_143, partial [Acidobacteriaceae bacterium]|nr:hypothetical protein [Acidobacteriaceae bacterium]